MSIIKLSRDSLIAIFIGAGLLLGWLEANRISGGGEIPWVPIQLPDGQRAIEFELGEYNELLVKSDDGQLYARWSNGKESGWLKVDDDKSRAISCNPTSTDALAIRKPPGKVVQSLVCRSAYFPDSTTYESYAIMRDGEIWHWQLTKGIAEGFAFLTILGLFLLFYGVGGWVMGYIAFFAIRRSGRLTHMLFQDRERVLWFKESSFTDLLNIVIVLSLLLLFYASRTAISGILFFRE